MKQSNSTPIVSVVIPLFNKEREVHRAIQSVLNQTITDFEVIVVNDGSTDKGPEIVKSFNDSRIRVIDQANAGVSIARNRGIEDAQSELIAFLDADDEWEPDFLETIIVLKREFPNCSVFATSYFIVNQDGIKRPALIRGLSRGFQKGILNDYFRIAAKSDPPLCSSATAVKKTTISSVGGFPVGVVSGEDLITWARLAVKYKIAYTVDPKAYFWEPIQLSDRPGRVPDEADFVGKELKYLLKICKSDKCKGLREYIALWHRMRANIYIRLQRKREARSEIFKALSYSKMTVKLYFFALLTLLPANTAKQLFKLLKILREAKPS